jgi:hypothetical protein
MHTSYPVSRKLRQEDLEFKESLGYIVRGRKEGRRQATGWMWP